MASASSSNKKYPFSSNIKVANFVTLKLKDNNYLLWETQVLSLIECKDILGLLTGETTALPQYIDQDGGKICNPSYSSWTRTDGLAKFWVVGTLSEDVLGHAVGLKTASQVWQALTEHYTQCSDAREFDLLAQLQYIAKGNNPLVVYLRQFKSICDELNVIGKPVSDVNKVFRLLEGFGDNYESFKTTMLGPPIPSYVEVIPQLQSYELRKKKNRSVGPNATMAFDDIKILPRVWFGERIFKSSQLNGSSQYCVLSEQDNVCLIS